MLEQKKNRKGCVFPLIAVFDVDRRACFVFIQGRMGKLVNISVSVYARMPILDMNADETRYEQSMNDFLVLPKIAVKKDVTFVSLNIAIKTRN